MLKSKQKKIWCVKSQGTEQFLVIIQEFISWVAGSNNLNTLRTRFKGWRHNQISDFYQFPNINYTHTSVSSAVKRWQNTEVYHLFSHNFCQKITSWLSYWWHLSFNGILQTLYFATQGWRYPSNSTFENTANSLNRQYYYYTSCASVTLFFIHTGTDEERTQFIIDYTLWQPRFYRFYGTIQTVWQ